MRGLVARPRPRRRLRRAARRPGRSLCACARRGCRRPGSPVRPTPCPDGLAACFAAGEYDGLLRAHGPGPQGARRVLPGRAARPGARWRRPSGGSSPRRTTRPGAGALAGRRRARTRARPGAPVHPGGRAPVCGGAAGRAGAPGPRAARRRRDQAGLDAGGAAANLAGSMARAPPARAALARSREPSRCVVCDDVLTTGATAREAQRALEEAGLPVRAVATVAATRKRLPDEDRAHRPRGLPLSGLAGLTSGHGAHRDQRFHRRIRSGSACQRRSPAHEPASTDGSVRERSCALPTIGGQGIRDRQLASADTVEGSFVERRPSNAQPSKTGGLRWMLWSAAGTARCRIGSGSTSRRSSPGWRSTTTGSSGSTCCWRRRPGPASRSGRSASS